MPLAAAALVAALGARRVVLAGLATASLVATALLGGWAAATEPTGALRWAPALALRLEVTGLGRMMVVLVPAIAVPVVIFALAGEAADPALARLVALLVGFVGAMELLVLAGDFLTLLGAWELVGACSWALIGHRWREDGVASSASAAFLTTRAGDVGIYLAAAAAFSASGSLAFSALPGRGWQLQVVAAGMLVAAAAKSAQLPFSPWLFSAMAGPTPASALLHSATMVAAGAYALARLAPSFAGLGWFGPTVAGVGLATALAGGVVASTQGDLKRALAGSTSAQYGLMFVAVGAGSRAAAGAHLLTHAAFKALLFLGAGVVIHAAGTGDLARLRSTRSRVPAVLFGVGVLALAAVPPLGGAASKEAVLAAAGDRWAWVGIGVLAAGALSAFYAIRLQLLTFSGPPTADVGEGPAPRAAASRTEIGALALLAAATLAFSVLWLPAGRELVARVAGDPLPEGGFARLAASALTVGAGAAVALALRRRDLLLSLGLATTRREAIAAWLGLPRLAGAAVVAPVLALSRVLAALDDRVIDAGVAAAARFAAASSAAFAWWGERGFDGVVRAVAQATLALGGATRRADERGVDALVEDVAGGVAVAGRESRRLQTGLSHQYYLMMAAGTVLILAILALGRL